MKHIMTKNHRTLHLIQTRYVLSLLFLLFPFSIFAQSPNYDDLPEVIDLTNWETFTKPNYPPEKTRIEVSPATFETITEDVLVKESYYGFKKPVYHTVSKKIMIREGYTSITSRPCETRVKEEAIMLKPAHEKLIKKATPNPFGDHCYDDNGKGIDTCHWQKIFVPAEYATIKKEEVVKAAYAVEKNVPAEYRELKVQVLDHHATSLNPKRSKFYNVEPVFRVIRRTVVSKPGTFQEIAIPITVNTITCTRPSETPVNLDRLKKRNDSGYMETPVPAPTPAPSEEIELDEAVISSYSYSKNSKAFLKPHTTTTGKTVTKEEISRLPERNVSSIAAKAAGVYVADGKAKKSRKKSRASITESFSPIATSSPPAPGKALPPPPPPPAPKTLVIMDDAEEGYAKEEIKLEMEPEQPIEAGILTAGEINDFSKWEMWEDISSIILQQWQQRWQLNPLERYSVQLTYEDGNPVVDRPVEVTDNNGKTWKARTDNTGKAELWGHAFGKEYKALTNPKIQVKQGGKMRKLPQTNAFANGINGMEVKGKCDYADNIDILFVVDATGSMKDEIKYLQVELNDVISQVQANQPDLSINLGSLFYRDHTDDYLTRKSDFSTNINQTTDFIKEQSADGGGDKPEAVEIALEEALQLSWSETARTRLLFLVLDASPRENEEVRKSLDASIRKAAEMGVKIIPVAGSGIDKGTEYLMRSMALLTNGRYVFLTDHSMVGGSHIAPTTDEFEMEFFNDLLIRIIEESVSVPACGLTAENKEAGSDNNPVEEDKDQQNKKDKTTTIKQVAKVYPNPASNFVNFESTTKISELLLTDLTGKIIQRWTKVPKGIQKIDLTMFPSGVYFVKYLVDKEWEMEKVVVTRE